MSQSSASSGPIRRVRKKDHPYVAIRNKKIRGEEHVSHRTNTIHSAKQIGPDCK